MAGRDTSTVWTARCTCGQVVCEAVGAPILTAICYCNDCQTGGRQIEALEGAPAALEPDGGASYLTYRDDRFRVVQGEELLVGYKIEDTSPTTRFVASCCNSAIYLKFKPGHWVSTYRRRYDGAEPSLPALEMCTNTRCRTATMPLPQDVPAYRRFPLKLFARLLAARLDMALGR